MKRVFRVIAASVTALALCHCTSSSKIKNADVVVSVADQKLGIYSKDGKLVHSYKISTSKFGLGDKPGSNCTPLGRHEVIAKIGHGLPAGAVLKSRHWNGEVLKPNAPGRDPIVSRILWLGGKESANKNAAKRFIYIHGTTEEFRLGSKASYGCVRMAGKDVIRVFDSVPVGANVVITKGGLPRQEEVSQPQKPVPAAADPSSSIVDVTDLKMGSKTKGEVALPKAIPVQIGPNGAILAKGQKAASSEAVGPPTPVKRSKKSPKTESQKTA